MRTPLGALAYHSASAIHSASFVVQDYVPAALVALVVLGFAAAIVVISIHRKDVN